MYFSGYHHWSGVEYLGVAQHRAYAWPLFCDNGAMIQGDPYEVTGATYDQVVDILSLNYPILPIDYHCSLLTLVSTDGDCELVDEDKIYEFGLVTTGIILNCGQDVGSFISNELVSDNVSYPLSWAINDNGSYQRSVVKKYYFDYVEIEILWVKTYIDLVEMTHQITGEIYPAYVAGGTKVVYTVTVTDEDTRKVTDCCLLYELEPDLYKSIGG